MLDKYQLGLEKLHSGEYELAYNFFNYLVIKNTKDFIARYYRGLIAFLFLNQDNNQVVQDLEMASKGTKKYKIRAYMLLCDLYASINDFENSIKYGKLSIKEKAAGSNTYLSLARSYYLSPNIPDNLKIAINYLDESINKFGEFINIHLWFKLEICYQMQNYKDALNVLDELIKTEEPSHKLYYYKGVLSFELANSTVEYIEAYDYFSLALNYLPNDTNTILNQIAILKYIGKVDKALELYNDYYHQTKDISFFKEKFKTLLNIDYKLSFKEAEEILQKDFDLELFELYTYSLMGHITSKEGIIKVLENLIKLEKFKTNYSISYYIIRILFYLDYLYQAEEYLLKLINKRRYEDMAYYFLSMLYQVLNKPFSIIYEISKKSYELEKYNSHRYLYTLIYLSENPLIFKCEIRRFFKDCNKSLCKRFISSIYLYGASGFRINIKKAFNYAKECYLENPHHPYYISWYGRLIELYKKDYQDAFKLYEKAYLSTKSEIISDCESVYAFYAHSLYKGIGTTKDEEKAKQVVLEGIVKFGVHNITLLSNLYAYFALKGDNRFNLKQALIYLAKARSASKYNIEIDYYQMLIYHKLNDHVNYKNAVNSLIISKKYDIKINKIKIKNKNNNELLYPNLIER